VCECLAFPDLERCREFVTTAGAVVEDRDGKPPVWVTKDFKINRFKQLVKEELEDTGAGFVTREE
jgi:hypothetical protein